MHVQHFSHLSHGSTIVLQRKKRNLVTVNNSAINYLMKSYLSHNIRFYQHHRRFAELSNFLNLKRNIKHMHSSCLTDRKNAFLKKCFFQIPPKHYLQTQIKSIIKKKQKISFFKRKKRKEHSNYFKYGISINHKNENFANFQHWKKNLQYKNNKTDANKSIKPNRHIHPLKSFHKDLQSINVIQSVNYIHYNTFHTRIAKCRKGINISGRIMKRKKYINLKLNNLSSVYNENKYNDVTNEQKEYSSNEKFLQNFEHIRKAHEYGQSKTDSSLYENKEINENNRNHHMNQKKNMEEPIKNIYNSNDYANHINSSKKSDKMLSKKIDSYNSKDFDKAYEDKSHEKGEMNIKRHDLILVALSGCIPFICFGFVDNSFMIIAGDLFDSTFCVFLGFSTLAAAGLGNLTSDVLGIFIGGYIEKIIAYVGFPRINLTNKQLKMNRTRRYYYIGSAVGIAIGCLLGMIPLFFIDNSKLEEKKKKKKKKKQQNNNNKIANIDKRLFQLVSNQLPNYVNSNYAFLFILDKSNRDAYSLIDNQIVRLPLDEDIIGHVYKNGKIISYESRSLLKSLTHSYKPSNLVEKEKYRNTGETQAGVSITTQREINHVDLVGQVDLVNKIGQADQANFPNFQKNQNFYFNKKRIDVHQVIAAPVFGLDDAQFLSMFCSHIAQEIEDVKDINDSLRLCKKIVYD
ncbi:conserved protein, unknown function [Plasmodium gonderi]|uniref:TMEM65 domain-containing protein n=1 Tax=Plasmodium gonderi TaxID=77519 RepID=A0A1Y1JJ49_PLAGO|nr:conserved protein, unknown function [Plasmodium gonderi]GAW81217.1 conserved protein, unknown function [Plasmodium gonderi]